MAQAQINTTYPLRAQLADGNSALYPQAVIYNAGNAVVATVNLVSVADGLYSGSYIFTATGFYSVVYTVYSDVGHVTVDTNYDRSEEQVECVSVSGDNAAIADAVWNATLADYTAVGSIGEALTIIRGLLHYNYILDQTEYNTKGLLIEGRVRVFKDKADTDAGINPLATLVISGTAENPPDNNLGKTLKVTTEV